MKVSSKLNSKYKEVTEVCQIFYELKHKLATLLEFMMSSTHCSPHVLYMKLINKVLHAYMVTKHINPIHPSQKHA